LRSSASAALSLRTKLSNGRAFSPMVVATRTSHRECNSFVYRPSSTECAKSVGSVIVEHWPT